MRSGAFIISLSGVCFITLGLAGCGATNPTQVPPNNLAAGLAARDRWLSPHVLKHKLIYVSDNMANQIVIYPQGQSNPGPIGLITTGISTPYGSFVDGAGTLYVANSGNGTVTEYLRGTTTPSTTLTGLTDPTNVSVDTQGNVYVTELSPGALVEFKKGSTTPTLTVTGLTHAQGLTNDRNRNAWVSWTQSGSNGRVSVCRPLSMTCKVTSITTKLAGDVKFDLKGNLVVSDFFATVLSIYAPGTLKLVRTIDVTGHQPYRLAFDPHDSHLYFADPANFAVAIYDYASGTLTGSITLGLQNAVGVSLDPHQRNGV